MQSVTLHNGDSNTPFNPSSKVNNVNSFNIFPQKTSTSSNVATQEKQVISETTGNNNIEVNGNGNGNANATANISIPEDAGGNVKLIKNQQTTKAFNRGRERGLFVEIQPARRNKLRKCLEAVKKPFEEAPNGLRLADPPIIDALLRCAEVSTSALKSSLEKAYSKPAYLPPADEVFELSLEEPQPNNQENNQTRLDRRDNRNRNLRVELSIATSNYISSIQRELTDEMGWQPDINAVANVLIDLGKHSSRQIVLTICEHFQEIVQNQKRTS